MSNRINHKRENKVKAAKVRNAQWAERNPIVLRYLSRVVMQGLNDECWVWCGYRNSEGRGVIDAGGKKMLASRLGWKLFVGILSEGECVCHRCDNPSCVRPSHLFKGSQKDNVRDCISKKRFARGSRREGAILNDSIVREILGSSEQQKVLADMYGVDPSVISRVKSGKAWGHVMNGTDPA